MMHPFRRGLRQGIPIALGYLSVSFSFGIFAVQSGLTTWQAVVISLTNLTSAGQLAGVEVIAAKGSLLELFLTQLVINIRYALMSLALSQKIDDSFHLPSRLLAAFGITDEIFAVSSIQSEQIHKRYLYGLTLIALLGWTGGTYLGAAAGTFLPTQMTNALGIALYGMFLAIILPPARASKGVCAVVCLAALASVGCFFFVKWLTSGFAMILCAIVAALVGAIFFPIPEEKEASAS